jgi:hypothetical protein
MRYEHFYAELGKLLYAVADIDGVITKKEKDILLDMVRKELAPAEKHTDQFGTDAAYYTEIEFELAEDQIMDSESAFNSFIDYVEEHHTAIDERMRDTSIRLAERLAEAYEGTNHKEKELVQKLRRRLSEIKVKKKNNG